MSTGVPHVSAGSVYPDGERSRYAQQNSLRYAAGPKFGFSAASLVGPRVLEPGAAVSKTIAMSVGGTPR